MLSEIRVKINKYLQTKVEFCIITFSYMSVQLSLFNKNENTDFFHNHCQLMLSSSQCLSTHEFEKEQQNIISEIV